MTSFRFMSIYITCAGPLQGARSWWQTDELGPFLIWQAIGREKQGKHILGPFQQMREEPDPS